MKVFISWSGERSKAVATALRSWLPEVIQVVEPWMSTEDIGAGVRWSAAIAAQLEASSFGIICLTPENQTAEWLHFEAGAIAKSVAEGLVAPYLFELTEGQVTGPLAQFQMKRADKEPTLDLLRAVNSQVKPQIAADKLNRAFEKWWPDLKDMLSNIGPAPTKAPPKRRPEEMIEETLELVRRLARSETQPLTSSPLRGVRWDTLIPWNLELETQPEGTIPPATSLDEQLRDNQRKLEAARAILNMLGSGSDRDRIARIIVEREHFGDQIRQLISERSTTEGIPE